MGVPLHSAPLRSGSLCFVFRLRSSRFPRLTLSPVAALRTSQRSRIFNTRIFKNLTIKFNSINCQKNKIKMSANYRRNFKMEKSKKLLILQASPRKNGNLYKMAESLSEKYRVKGFETETVDVCALNFHRCIACMKCRSCGERLRSLQVMPCPLF